MQVTATCSVQVRFHSAVDSRKVLFGVKGCITMRYSHKVICYASPHIYIILCYHNITNCLVVMLNTVISCCVASDWIYFVVQLAATLFG